MAANPPKGIGSKTQAFLVGLAYGLGSLGTLTAAIGAVHNDELQLIVGIIVALGGVASGSIKEALKALPGT